jgi:hypothetical protein
MGNPVAVGICTPLGYLTASALIPPHQPSPSRPQHLANTFTTMTKSKPQSAPRPAPKWQLVSWQKKDEQYARIPPAWRLQSLPSAKVTNYMDIPRQCGILTKEELEITENYDATALADAIRSRKLKCIDVTRAFCKVHSRRKSPSPLLTLIMCRGPPSHSNSQIA